MNHNFIQSCLKIFQLKINDPRFFFSPRPPVKPTAAITHHEPGLPPGWTRPPTRPNPSNRLLSTTQEYTVESQVIEVSSPPNYYHGNLDRNDSTGLPPGVHPPMIMQDQNNPPKNAVIDWILGLFGNKPPTQQPPVIVTPTSCGRCKCGASYKYHRIVGGVETTANAYPWMVYLTYSGRFYCGASVINDRYILTAAHCINGFPKERLAATFLDHDRSTTYETKTFTRKIANILKHGGYGVGGTFNNDIALLKLNEPLDFSGLVKPVSIVTGWGATESTGQVSNVLREVDVPVISNMECRSTGYGRRITDNMICAGYPEGQKDACQGDSGGPMHIANNSLYSIIGVVSWGEGCAQANYPGVYTRVNRYITRSFFLSWETNLGCGITNRQDRILGGEVTKQYEFPWLTHIQTKDKRIIPSSLINDRYVITSASLLGGLTPFDLKILIGLQDRCNPDVSSTIFSVKSIKIHPLYSVLNRAHDLALIRLNGKLLLIKECLQYACLFQVGRSYLGEVSTIIGWTRDDKQDSLSNCRPLKLGLPILGAKECVATSPDPNFFSSDKRCAGVIGARSPICKDDAGGPVMFRDRNGVYEIIAIVTGWGATESTGQVSNVLREVDVPVISNMECRSTGYGRRITDNMICAGYPEGQKDACQEEFFLSWETNLGCGITNRQDRILGGEVTKQYEFPWLTHIQTKDKRIIPSSLINDRYVITSASLLGGLTPFDLKILIGLQDRCNPDVSSTIFSVKSIKIHPLYSVLNRAHDLALIRLNGEVTIDKRVSPICLPLPGRSYLGEVSTIIGWTRDDKQDSLSNCRPLKLGLPILGAKECVATSPDPNFFSSDKRCAGVIGARSPICKDDAGGPVMFRDRNGVYEIIGLIFLTLIMIFLGVLSDRNVCGPPASTAMYTRIAEHMSWIKEHTTDAYYCVKL
ncbi:tryptase-related [Holotrichia oblita]|uniref:Tryptase-related n=1 Tax=Holotrichia oblita TaxID=644536 RepID=A0ACB9SRQ3_HOLOL|nr:tryptase-related [Holotrichia oblita]